MKSLFEQWSHTKTAYGACAILPLGQHSFLVKAGVQKICFDPYLTADAARLVPPLLQASELVDLDLILGSHDHGDHIDRTALPILAQASPLATLLVPEKVRRSNPVPFPAERIYGMNDATVWEKNGIRVTGVASAHEFLDYDARVGLYPYLGFVVEVNGLTIYHAGDCCRYEGLLTKLQAWPKIDVAMLPINGRDAWRYSHGFIGNMTYQEAADLAGELQVGLTLPAHFDMFEQNLGEPNLFCDYMRVKYPRLHCSIPIPGVIMIS